KRRVAVIGIVGVANAGSVVDQRTWINRPIYIRTSIAVTRSRSDRYRDARVCLVARRNAILSGWIGITQRIVANVTIQIPALWVRLVLIDQRLIRACKPALGRTHVPSAEVIQPGFCISFFG